MRHRFTPAALAVCALAICAHAGDLRILHARLETGGEIIAARPADNRAIEIQQDPAAPERGATLWIGPIHRSRPTLAVQDGVWGLRGVVYVPGVLVVKSAGGEELFRERMPGRPVGPAWVFVPWPAAEAAARAMWDAAPAGRVRIVSAGVPDIVADLDGFCDVWAWGVEHAGMNRLDAPAP